VSFDQPFRQQYETENLRPFRDNVSDDLPPFGLGVHRSIERNPADSRDDEEHAKRVVAQSLPDGAQAVPRWTSALSRSLSYKYLVANIMTTTPDQSAIALAKE